MFLNSKSLSDPLCNVPSLYPYEISVDFASEFIKKEFGETKKIVNMPTKMKQTNRIKYLINFNF